MITLSDALAMLRGTGREVSRVKVAVVDSGIHVAHPHVARAVTGISLPGPPDDLVDRLGHGTAVAAAILEKAPAVELLVVKVFAQELVTSASMLAAGIEWAAQQGAHLINLSLGTTNASHAPRLQQAIDAARAAGGLVVSAAEQDGRTSLPGGLRGVIAVTANWDLPRDGCRVTLATADRVVVEASGYPRPIPGVPPERNLKGISFAVANVSGLAARLLSLNGSSAG